MPYIPAVIFRTINSGSQYAELSNLSVHLYMRSLRPAGTTTSAVPMGYGFSAPFNLAFPNYFEIMAWATVVAMTGSIAGTCVAQP